MLHAQERVILAGDRCWMETSLTWFDSRKRLALEGKRGRRRRFPSLWFCWDSSTPTEPIEPSISLRTNPFFARELKGSWAQFIPSYPIMSSSSSRFSWHIRGKINKTSLHSVGFLADSLYWFHSCAFLTGTGNWKGGRAPILIGFPIWNVFKKNPFYSYCYIFLSEENFLWDVSDF